MPSPLKFSSSTSLLLLLLTSVASCASAASKNESHAGDVANSLLDAFSGATLLAALEATSATANTSSTKTKGIAPPVTALDGFSAPLGSGDNLAEFANRVSRLKEYYQDARLILGTDDAVRIAGYLLTLESLGIQFVTAYPIAELSLLLTNLSLLTSVAGIVSGAIGVAGYSVALAGNIISLQSAIQAAQAAGVFPGHPNQLVDQLVVAGQPINNQLDWVLQGGMTAPLTLTSNLLTSVTDSLARLSSYQLPADLLSGPLFTTAATAG